jgi:hypothetical protein
VAAATEAALPEEVAACKRDPFMAHRQKWVVDFNAVTTF